MPPDQRPSYPRTPAYGEGFPSGGAGPRPGSPAPRPSAPTGPPVEPRGVWLALGLSVAVNLLTLVGVLALGWPAGNVFLLFWCEDVVLGLITLVRVGTAEVDPSRRVQTALFFCVHYGIFCSVHLGFTLVVAWRLGWDLGVLALGVPVVLVVLRYAVELVRTWFGPEGLRARTTPRQAMFAPYPRIVVLQVGVIVAFLLLMASFFAGLPDSPVASYGRVVGTLPDWLGRPAVLAVVVLLLVKTLVDLLTTRRALRAR
ncbi:DUF6498-containing protein [Microlunatus antarcticus]|uniref:Uncharacterized protein n=1 Tax=Microlunatus antarcticus TaxID=53388 RepID=A0A7W5P7A5_9ACTN|nr:hypothetical protein [Microlunatus antarcticus]